MNIVHLKYFIEIVKSEFNVSFASKRLNISQPALSSIIKNFEGESNVALFIRHKGRLEGLTPAGEAFYEGAINLVEHYENMISSVNDATLQKRGKVKIGIPPLVITTVFSNIIPNMILQNPEIEFEIIELGAFELRSQILAKNLDFAILLEPTELSMDIIEYEIQSNELIAFMGKQNPLAYKKQLDWRDLQSVPLAIFDDSYMIHHKLKSKFNQYKITPKVVITSGIWDYLLSAVRQTDILTILPKPIGELFNLDNVSTATFKDPIEWKVVLCLHKKKRYSHLENHVLHLLRQSF